jgi:hypothetical protein
MPGGRWCSAWVDQHLQPQRMCWREQTNKVPFSAIYLLFALLIVAGIFIITLNRRGLKQALIFSFLGLGILIALFVVLLIVILNNM